MRRAIAALLMALATAAARSAAAAAAFGGFAGPEAASRDPAALCESAAISAARAEGVPAEVMRALTLTETGRRLDGANRPWAWTVNMEGEGRWFPDRRSAIAWVRERHARGARSYDVGCFQINQRWHGQEFASLEEMFDPQTNALYAARFLKSLKAEAGSWEGAAGFFHSRTPEFSARYRSRFAQILASLGPPAPAPGPGPAPKRDAGTAGPLIVFAARRTDAVGASGSARGGSLALSALTSGRGLLAAARPLLD